MDFKKVNSDLDKNLTDFVTGEKNVLVGTSERPVILARSYKNGREYVSGYYGEIPQAVTYGPNYARGKKKLDAPTQGEIKQDKATHKVNKISKGTGGELAYVMLLTKHKDKIKGLSINSKAILISLFIDGIQWNTGKLTKERSKKPHTLKSIADLITVCSKTAKIALQELSDKDIIQYDKSRKFYFMSTEIARKGAVVEDENKI